ncbi:hypothetical protein [Aeoliella sp. SH292]|uniref:hypothetical protein n=1 Tax=Aeoliella sp. SH292 TaxID=3454464 RepID=UPI003F992E91
MSGITVFCFAASYFVALVLEIAGLWVRFGWHRVAMVVMAMAGLVAHTIFLATNSTADLAILSSPESWYLVVAWVLAAFYLWVAFSAPQTAMGLFVLPLVLSTIGFAELSSHERFSHDRASQFWSGLHGALMTLATVTVCVGFIAGLMYLIQSYRLKQKLPPSPQFRLPSLEWLERTNSRSLGLSALLVSGGFFTGVVLSRMQHVGDSDYRLHSDPVVITLLVMLVWLVVAEMFRLVYPSARGGRKVAYLTLASFGFLVITLIAFTITENHGRGRNASTRDEAPRQASTQIADELRLVGMHSEGFPPHPNPLPHFVRESTAEKSELDGANETRERGQDAEVPS